MISIKNLSFTYPDGTVALKDLSLEIDRGECVGIIGSNGAGKSTLVNHLNGYYLPTQGEITINGLLLHKKTVQEIRKTVGLIFQNPDDQLFMPRIIDDVVFGLKNLHYPEHKIQEIAETTLRDFHLWELRHKSPIHLSNGQKRFAAFATILCMQPEVLIMDEPTSDLDPKNRKSLLHRISSMKSTRIIVSHDLDFLWDTCRYTYIMNQGRIAEYGLTKTLLAQESLLQQYDLELPLKLQK